MENIQYKQIGVIDCRVIFEEENIKDSIIGNIEKIRDGLNNTSHIKDSEVSLEDDKLHIKFIIINPVILQMSEETVEGMITYKDILQTIMKSIEPLNLHFNSADFSDSILDDEKSVFENYNADYEYYERDE